MVVSWGNLAVFSFYHTLDENINNFFFEKDFFAGFFEKLLLHFTVEWAENKSGEFITADQAEGKAIEEIQKLGMVQKARF